MLKSRTVAKALVSIIEDDGVDAKTVAERFLDFAEKNNLNHQLSTVLFHLELERDRRTQEKRLSLTVADQIPEKLIKDVKKYVGAAKDTDIETKVDKNIIGGFVAQYKNTVYDGSVSHSLEKLRLALIN